MCKHPNRLLNLLLATMGGIAAVIGLCLILTAVAPVQAAAPNAPAGKRLENPLLQDTPLDVVTITGPEQINLCDRVTFTIRFTNGAVTATQVVITSHMSSGFTPTRSISDVGTVGPNETITRTAVYTATCDAVSGQHTTRLSQDGAGDVTVYTDFVVNPGAITVRKNPDVIEATLDDVVTWVVTIENTGDGQVSNVRIADVLGSGLAYVSGLTTETVPLLAPGKPLTWPVSARVTGCSDLENKVVATWGCGTESCSAPQSESSAIDLQIREPDLVYDLPLFDVPYCADSQVFTIPISNVGDGTAYTGTLEAALAPFDVYTTPGVRYDNDAFYLPDIQPDGVYTLVLSMTLASGFCPPPTNGSFDFDLRFYDQCDNLQSTNSQSATWQLVEGVGQLDVSTSMPDIIERGEVITAYITVGVQDISDTVAVTDALPLGWRVIDAGGGITAPGHIHWTLSETTRLTAVLDTTDTTVADDVAIGMTNTLTATGLDCRACPHVATDSSTVNYREGVVGEQPSASPTATVTMTLTVTPTVTFTPSASLQSPVSAETIIPTIEPSTSLFTGNVIFIILGFIGLVGLLAISMIWWWTQRKKPTVPPVSTPGPIEPPVPTPSSAGPVAPLAAAYLQSQGTTGGPHEFYLKEPETLIGRAENADIRIDETFYNWETVSREHAWIRQQEGQMIVIDNNSTNGTYINGRRTQRNLLRDGWRLQVGDVAFIFHSGHTRHNTGGDAQ